MSEQRLREALKAILEDIRTQEDGIRFKTMQKAFAALAEPIAAPADEARDAARLDWLDTQAVAVDHRGYGEYGYYFGHYDRSETIREFIDRAMATPAA